MHKVTPWGRKVTSVRVNAEMSPEEEVRMCTMQGKGIVKYLQPDGRWVIADAVGSVHRLLEMGQLDWKSFERWVRDTNPAWLPVLRKGLFRMRWKGRLRTLVRPIARRVLG